MSNNQIIINNIRRLIRLKGLKQCAVAEKAGFSPNAFSAMLTERKAIMAEYMPDIASALGVPVNELFKKGDDCVRKTKKKKTTSGRKQSFLREEVAFLYACLLIKSRFRE